MIQLAQSGLQAGVSPQDFFRALQRHKRKGILTSVAIFIGAAVALWFWPHSYQSEARLFVQLGRESVSLDPTATIGPTINVSESRENELNSILEILKSRNLAEQVVSSLGPELILNRQPKSDNASPSGGWASALLDMLPKLDAITVSDHERAVTRLENSLEVRMPKKTSIVAVRYLAASPEAAQRVVDKVVETYLVEHARVHHIARSYGFFDEQKRLLQEKLRQAYADLRDAKDRAGVVSIDGARAIIQDAIRAIEAQATIAHSELAASEAKITALKQSVAAVPERQVTQDVSGIPNHAADLMRDTLFRLQATQADLQARMTPEHPQMVAISDQIKRLQATLDEEPSQRTQSTTSLHPGHQQLELSWLTEQANLAALQARVKSLDAQHSVEQARIAELNAAEAGIAQAQQQVDLLQANYRTDAEKLEQARIDQQLESAQISNVNILQPASYVAKATSPNALLVMGCGLFLALAGGILVCLSCEHFDRRLRSSGDVYQGNGAEVAATRVGGSAINGADVDIESPWGARLAEAAAPGRADNGSE